MFATRLPWPAVAKEMPAGKQKATALKASASKKLGESCGAAAASDSVSDCQIERPWMVKRATPPVHYIMGTIKVGGQY